MGPTPPKKKFDGPTMDFHGLHKRSKNCFGIKLLKKERRTHISDEKSGLQTKFSSQVHGPGSPTRFLDHDHKPGW